MKKTEQYEERVVRTRVLKTMCDKCGRELNDLEQTRLAGNIRDLDIEYTYGNNYGYDGGGSGLKLAVNDLCHQCTLDLFALLSANGFRVTQEEWDY